jgi:hypothetical protein
VLLGHGHPCVEEVLAVVIQRGADGLGHEYAGRLSVSCFGLTMTCSIVRDDAPVEVGSKGTHAQELHEGSMLDSSTWVM